MLRIRIPCLPATLVCLAGVLCPQSHNPPETSLLASVDPENYLTGRFRPDTTEDFIQLPAELTGGRRLYLRSEAAAAFAQMTTAGAKDGVNLTVISATRSFRHQRKLWDALFKGERFSRNRNLAEVFPDTLARILAILEYSSAPGTSRHHWGTDVDLISTSPAYWQGEEGAGVLTWLMENAAVYGFHLAYPEGRVGGYKYEAWHWSYTPLSRPLLARYNELINEDDIQGFLGDRAYSRLPWRENYVNGVGTALKGL